MGAIVSRITGAPYVPSGFAELVAACAITSTIGAALTRTSPAATWQELAASADVNSSIAATLTRAAYQELAASAGINSTVAAALTVTAPHAVLMSDSSPMLMSDGSPMLFNTL